MSLKRTKSLQILCLCLTAGLVLAQQWWEKKPYSEWSAKQVQRMLDRSPWSTVHTVAVLNPGYYQSSRSTGIPPFADDSDYNPTMLGMGVQERLNHFHLRFLTAKPIRLALARDMTVRAQQEPEPAAIERFVQYTDDRFIVLLMTLSSEPPGADSINQYMSTLLTLTTPDLTADTSLATRTGKRVYLARYEPPGPDGLGAKFLFPQKVT